MGTMRRIAATVGILAAVVALSTVAVAAKSGKSSRLPQGSETVNLNPADFTTNIDNPYWPMRPGTRWVYRETDPEGTKQRVVVTVTDRTKKIANGITARVVHAYKLARARILMAGSGSGEVDADAIRETVERAVAAMEDVRRIKSQLKGANSSIDKARDLLDEMAERVRDYLAEIDALLLDAEPAE